MKLGPKARLLNSCDIDNVTGCYNWTRAKTAKGYGIMSYKSTNWLVHRLAYHLWIGEIPTGMLVLHQCNNPTCFNPKHLTIGRDLDNVEYMHSCGRAYKARGELSGKSKITEIEALEIKQAPVFVTSKDLADRYNISTRAVNQIRSKETWCHLTASNTESLLHRILMQKRNRK